MEFCVEMEAPDGSFLVRERGIYVGDYVLSFWHREKVQHCRIHWWQDSNSHKFFLTDTQVFDSLCDLVTYCWEMPLRYSGLEIRLTEGRQRRSSTAKRGKRVTFNKALDQVNIVQVLRPQ